MKYEDKKTLALSFLMIAVLGFFSYRNLSGIENVAEISPLPPIPDIEKLPTLNKSSIEDIEDLLQKSEMNMVQEPEITEYSQHSVDNTITFEYPSHWTVSDMDANEEYEDLIEILFVAEPQNIAPSTIVIVSKLNAESIEDSVDVIRKVFRQEGIAIRITERAEAEEGIYLEIDYEYDDGQVTRSKERIVEAAGNFYLLSVITHANQFEYYFDQMSHIINSIQIVN